MCGSVTDRVGGPLLLSGQGLGIANSTTETMKIHEENQARLQAMSKSEILEEQRKLLAQLGELNTLKLKCCIQQDQPFTSVISVFLCKKKKLYTNIYLLVYGNILFGSLTS